MAQVRSFEKPFELVDYTEELLLVPNKWGLINELGIFRNEGVAQHSVTVESNQGTLGLVTDKVRGERNNVNKDDTRNLRSFAIPHFPLDDGIKPEDVQGKRAYGSADAAETEAAVIARKLERIRMSHAATLEAARAYALTTGAIYAPNGTVAGNFYTDFGVTRKEIDFALGTTTTDVLAKSVLRKLTSTTPPLKNHYVSVQALVYIAASYTVVLSTSSTVVATTVKL